MPHSVYSRLSFDFTRFMPAGLTGTLSFTQLPRAPVNTVPRHTHKHTRIHTHTLTYIYIYTHTYNPLSNSALGQPTNVQQQHLSCALTNSRTVLYIHRCCTYTHTHTNTYAHLKRIRQHTHTRIMKTQRKKKRKIPLILPQFGR